MSEKVIAYIGSDKNMTVYSLNVFKEQSNGYSANNSILIQYN